MFLGLEPDYAVEAFDIQQVWDVVRGDDGSIMVHHPWRDYWLGKDAAAYRSQVEWTLPDFKTAAVAANTARNTKFDGRVASGTQYPRVIVNASQLHQAYVDSGAVNHPDGPPKTELPPACGKAVPDQTSNRGLMRDCFTLLGVKDALRGTGTLNWSVDTTIGRWDGVTVEGTPQRVTKLELANRSLTGTIPAALAKLELTTLKLAGNSLTGCIPAALKSIATNDLASLGLFFCFGAPENLSATASGETSVGLAWNTAPNVAKYGVEYAISGSDLWTVDEDAITATTQTVDGLRCGTGYRFRVSAYGDGVVNAAAWSDPSAPVDAATTACVTPVFAQSSYSFSVVEGASAGTAVGSVSATDPNGDTVSYSISAGNVGSAFAISSTGAITVAGALDSATTSSYTLTVEVSDGTNTAEAPVEIEVTSVCGNGVVVPDADANAGLVGDCETLLGVKDTLRGTGALNWSTATAIGQWDGVTVGGTPKRVQSLRLGDKGLTGSIPAALGTLAGLTRLDLSDNQLSGGIPSALGDLSKLEELDLEYNGLSGGIPTTLGSLTGLRSLSLSANQLTGSIPSSLGKLTRLTSLDLAENRLSGAPPSELGNLRALQYLSLGSNGLTGPVPSWVSGLTALQTLYLDNNALTGSIPATLGGLSKLTVLSLSRNQLTGSIPGALGNLSQLEELALSGNRLTGSIPDTLTKLKQLEYLYLSGNTLTGCVPAALRKVATNDLASLRLADCA